MLNTTPVTPVGLGILYWPAKSLLKQATNQTQYNAYRFPQFASWFAASLM